MWRWIAVRDEIILAIESSCDETAAAIVKNGREVLSNVVSTQIAIHQKFGGVVPEVASRKHMEYINVVIAEALEQANLTLDEVTAVAVTYGPGLVGALLVGVAAAKALAFGAGKPLIGVHHIEGHIYGNFLANPELEMPLLCLVVSGGHTNIVLIKGHGEYVSLGQTRDDAVGEAFDKVARAMGLSYPGGPLIDKLAKEGEAKNLSLPRAWLEEGSYDFSFSGLKSAVLNYLNRQKLMNQEIVVADVAAAFQEAVIDVLVTKVMKAAEEYKIDRILLAGGVAANSGLRQALSEACAKAGKEVHFPPLKYCTDNAAMIGAAAYYKAIRGEYADLSLNAVANLPFSEII